MMSLPKKKIIRGIFDNHIVGEEDKVFAMMTITSTDKQTGKRVSLKTTDLFRIEMAWL